MVLPSIMAHSAGVCKSLMTAGERDRAGRGVQSMLRAWGLTSLEMRSGWPDRAAMTV